MEKVHHQESPEEIAKKDRIAKDLFSNLADIFPTITKNWRSYNISCRLPLIYKQYIRYISCNEKLREYLNEEIKKQLLINHYEEIDIVVLSWSEKWLKFSLQWNWRWIEPDDRNYSAHNIDYHQDASFLLECLSIYLPKLYFLLSEFALGNMELPKEKKLKTPDSFNYFQIDLN